MTALRRGCVVVCRGPKKLVMSRDLSRFADAAVRNMTPMFGEKLASHLVSEAACAIVRKYIQAGAASLCFDGRPPPPQLCQELPPPEPCPPLPPPEPCPTSESETQALQRALDDARLALDSVQRAIEFLGPWGRAIATALEVVELLLAAASALLDVLPDSWVAWFNDLLGLNAEQESLRTSTSAELDAAAAEIARLRAEIEQLLQARGVVPTG